MWPTIFEIGGVRVPAYAFFMVLGYVAALLAVLGVTRSDAARGTSLNRADVLDLFVVMLVSSVLGAKLGHVLFEAPGHITEDGRRIESLWELLSEDPLHPLRLGEGGYVWYGGLLGALFTSVVWFRRRPHLNALLYSDAFAPAVMIGAALGRVGCFLEGCCYGVPADVPWAVAFPSTDGVPVHPTQIYDASFAICFGGFLWWWFSRRRFDGENIALLLIGYPVARFTTEIFRGDPERGHLGPLSTSQIISFGVLAAGVALYVWASRRAAFGDGAREGPPDEVKAGGLNRRTDPNETTGRSAG